MFFAAKLVETLVEHFTPVLVGAPEDLTPASDATLPLRATRSFDALLPAVEVTGIQNYPTQIAPVGNTDVRAATHWPRPVSSGTFVLSPMEPAPKAHKPLSIRNMP